jgi:AcrR family transcriptional regulator
VAAAPTSTKHAGSTRLSADERRVSVLRAAMVEFARGGYAGTSTETIAERAAISQPYLFRLFGTKRELFVATMGLMHSRIEAAFRSAASGLTGVDAMMAMGASYKELLAERDLLLVQLHAYAASEDEVIRQAARQGFRQLWTVVEELTGLPEEAIRAFFAQGMLLNVMAAVDAVSLDESWARACQAPNPEQFFGPAASDIPSV